MSHKLGVSGSIILSNPEFYSELFWEEIDHIEIGEFPDEKAIDKFLWLCKARIWALAYILHYFEMEASMI